MKKYKPKELLEKINDIFPDVKHMAMDKNLSWGIFNSIPKHGSEKWLSNEKAYADAFIENINRFCEIDYEGSWENSLHSIGVDENTPSGTIVEVRGNSGIWIQATYIGYCKIDNVYWAKPLTNANPSLPWLYCRIKKGE